MNLRKINHFNRYFPIIVGMIWLLFSCNLTKNVADNEQLLVKNKVEIKAKHFKQNKAGFNAKDIEQILTPEPNARFLFFPLKLAVYNLSDKEKIDRKNKRKTSKCVNKKEKRRSKLAKKLKTYDKKNENLSSESRKYKKYARRISSLQNRAERNNLKKCEKKHWTERLGEAPVLYRLNDKYRNLRKIRIFLKAKGYYDARITAENKTRRFNEKKVVVKYKIEPDTVHKIRHVYYEIDDKNIRNIVLKDTVHTFLKSGKRFDTGYLESEQERLANLIRNSGYYNFSKEFVRFTADTINKRKQDDIYVIIKKDTLNNIYKDVFKKYIIKNVFIYPDFDAREALTRKEDYFLSHDTLIYYSKNDTKYYFLYNKMPRINPKAVMKGIYITPGKYFNLDDVNATYRYLASLPIIKIANVKFTEDTKYSSDTLAYLNCEIRLTQAKLQSRKTSVEFTNTSGNLGVGANLSYTHNNIFRNTEVLDLGVKLAFKRLSKSDSYDDNSYETFFGGFNSREYGINFSLRFPRLMAPVPMKKFMKRRNPKTVVSGKYDFWDHPDFSYTVAGGNIGYFWNSSKTISHGFLPLIADIVELKNPSDDFLELISKFHLEETYETHFIFGSSYKFTYNNQFYERKRNTVFLSAETKIAGNSLVAIMDWTNREKENGSYKINDIVFAQFIKGDIELRYHLKLLRDNDKIAFRFFSGIAYPYGNLKVIPFGERYFVGGANSIRAWQSHSLGPGSYVKNDSLESFPNQTADIRLEANIEYRMHLFWKIEGAIFADAGNIWAVNSRDTRPGALFQFDTFYKEIAVGTGYGLRLDLSFVLLRLDMGLKLRDPELPESRRWIIGNRPFNRDDWTLFFAIGYPF
ncbi:MAG: BamA/TamA family outer membrane protein [Chlorobi bacterium]|nr:BamA/TamA family outer membrane protein [Chlorobiota bacterium]